MPPALSSPLAADTPPSHEARGVMLVQGGGGLAAPRPDKVGLVDGNSNSVDVINQEYSHR